MRKIIAFSLLSCTAFAAEYGFSNYYFADPDHPIHLEGRYRWVGSADFKDKSKGHLNYADAYASVLYTWCMNEENSLSFEGGYDYLKLGWDKNPRFDQTNFNYAVASIGYVSTTLEKWRWILNGGFSVDANNFNFGQTGVYHGMLWGRYQFTERCGLNVGWMGWAGVENGYMLPIMGFDWRMSDHWRATFIYPIDFTLAYLFNDNWSLEATYSGFGGPYKYPRRSQEGTKYHDPIFMVYALGGEIMLKYDYHHLFRASIGGGWNGGGWVHIADSNNKHGKYYHYNSAPYAQASLAFTF